MAEWDPATSNTTISHIIKYRYAKYGGFRSFAGIWDHVKPTFDIGTNSLRNRAYINIGVVHVTIPAPVNIIILDMYDDSLP